MSEMITVVENKALLSPEVASKIAECERRIKEIKDAEESLREAILTEMESKGIKKIETEEMTITYKAPYDKEKFEAKQFREAYPEMYDDYVTISTCKASVTIKLKEKA